MFDSSGDALQQRFEWKLDLATGRKFGKFLVPKFRLTKKSLKNPQIVGCNLNMLYHKYPWAQLREDRYAKQPRPAMAYEDLNSNTVY